MTIQPKPGTITLASCEDAYNFTLGMPLRMTDAGDLVPLTRWQRRTLRVREFASHWTRWFRPRAVCSAADVEAGSITLCLERWSWRRWRWERT